MCSYKTFKAFLKCFIENITFLLYFFSEFKFWILFEYLKKIIQENVSRFYVLTN